MENANFFAVLFIIFALWLYFKRNSPLGIICATFYLGIGLNVFLPDSLNYGFGVLLLNLISFIKINFFKIVISCLKYLVITIVFIKVIRFLEFLRRYIINIR